MRNTFLSIAVAAATAAVAAFALAPLPAAAQGAVVMDPTPDPTVAQPLGLARTRAHTAAHVIAPRAPEVPRNTLITSSGKTVTLNPDGSVKTREVASNTKAKGKVKYRTY